MPFSFLNYLSRNNYHDNSPTPLFRGFSHFLTFIWLIRFTVNNINNISIFGTISLYCILSSYFFSILLHCIKFPKSIERIINIIDHIAIHHHIFGCMLNLRLSSLNLLLIPEYILLFILQINLKYVYLFSLTGLNLLLIFLFLLNYVIDTLKFIKYGYKHILNTNHYGHFLISVILSFFQSIIFLYNIYNLQIFLPKLISIIFTFSFYTIGKIIYYLNKRKIYLNKYWSYHETFHLFIVIGTIGTIKLLTYNENLL